MADRRATTDLLPLAPAEDFPEADFFEAVRAEADFAVEAGALAAGFLTAEAVAFFWAKAEVAKSGRKKGRSNARGINSKRGGFTIAG